MFPHSQFAQRASAATVYGRNTPLYAFIGPSDEFDVPIEVVVEGLPDQELSSLEGMSSTTPIITDLSGTSAGGTAIIKPIQRPGAVLPPVQTSSSSESGTVIASDRRDVIEYVVQSGDVIGSIAEAHGVSVQTILTENDLTARSYIRPGQVLSILPVSGVTHTVRSGDTVIKIANTYDAEADDVIAFNRLKNDGSDIVVGETLVIPGGTKQAAPTYVASNPTPVVSNPIKQVVAPPPSVQTPAGSGYIWPTSATIVTQYYGWRHTGIDIAGPAGSALYAARSGEVIKSQCGWNGGYGCHIIIDHGGGVQTLYAHALTDGLLVGVGEQVTQGDTIALMGSTGRSTGPHIHFEVRVNGQRVNPYQYIR
jgi:murein DD-endopeptidase MepM/ murein hydrolase activator NlpD